MNPWLEIPLEDYEKHMSQKDVFQLQVLSRITGITVKLFYPKTILILGAAGGNGFEHFDRSMDVYAVDINSSYLEVCRKRYSRKVNKLTTTNIDADAGPLPVEDNTIELVICHLFLEYVDEGRAISEICRVLKSGGVLNIVLQKSGDKNFVSDTGVTSLESLSGIAKELSAADLEELCRINNFIKMNYMEESLPNGKSFMIYNYRKMSP